jgi:hypothetical protein
MKAEILRVAVCGAQQPEQGLRFQEQALIGLGIVACWRRPKTEPLLRAVPIEN